MTSRTIGLKGGKGTPGSGSRPKRSQAKDRLRVLAPPEEQDTFTESEITEVLTSLYMDGAVDLVLADRIAALMRLRAAVDHPPPPQVERCACGVLAGVSHYCSKLDHCWVGKPETFEQMDARIKADVQRDELDHD